MDTAYKVTDEQLKAQSKAVLHQLLHELSMQQGYTMRDADYIEYIQQHTDTLYPTTTWQHYRNGSRLRLPFLLLMSYLFKRSLASFFGPELAKKDYRLAAQTYGFVLDDYLTGDVAMTIPLDLAKGMQLQSGTAKVLQVSKANNANPSLRLGSLAIIDTSFTKPSLSGNYLIEKDGKPTFAAITANATGSDIELQFGDTRSQLDGPALNKLVILGRVVDTLG